MTDVCNYLPLRTGGTQKLPNTGQSGRACLPR